nr:hypothetical protein [Rhodococcus sp. (in: high G+C Gram-positive bacteria)]
MAKTNLTEYPVDRKTRDLLGYVDGWSEREGVDWLPNDPFTETFQVMGYGRGRSSIKFMLVAEDGRRYEMFAKDFTELVMTSEISAGVVTGTFQVVKRGQNYGLVRVEPC